MHKQELDWIDPDSLSYSIMNQTIAFWSSNFMLSRYLVPTASYCVRYSLLTLLSYGPRNPVHLFKYNYSDTF